MKPSIILATLLSTFARPTKACFWIFGDCNVRKEEQCQPVSTVQDFNLDEYIQLPWYVQQQAVTRYLPADQFYCVRARYEKPNRSTFPWGYTVRVYNEARDAVDGNLYGDSGFFGDLCAYQRGPEDSKLAVAPCVIPKEAGGDYWVVDYDEKEGYALVSGGQPTVPSETNEGKCRTGEGINEAGLWIFTREQNPAPKLVEKVREIASQKGFDVDVLLRVTQEGCQYGDDDQSRMLMHHLGEGKSSLRGSKRTES